MNSHTSPSAAAAETTRPAVPILALDLPGAREALDLVDRLPRADFVKVGLQLYTAEGPSIVRALKERGKRVFLDLKLHDIPNTVAGAVRSAAGLGVELLTVHAAGGEAMLRAASTAAEDASERLELLAVTVLTSLSTTELADSWGREPLRVADEVVRLASLAHRAGVSGVVASVQEVVPIRAALGEELRILTPGIRLSGDAANDQSRVATPSEAVRLGSNYLVIGRTVTAARDPALAYERVLEELAVATAEVGSG